MKYIAIVERTRTGFSAYFPDVPGCVAAASTRSELDTLLQGALEMHLEGMAEDGLEPPEPTTLVSEIEFAA